MAVKREQDIQISYYDSVNTISQNPPGFFDFGRFAIVSIHFNRPLVVQLDVICDDVARAQLFAVHDVGAAT